MGSVSSYLGQREFKYVWVVKLLEVLFLPCCRRVLADRLLFGELDVVERPVGGYFGDVGEEDCDRSLHIDVASTEVELILSLVITRRILGQQHQFRAHKLAKKLERLIVAVGEGCLQLSIALVVHDHGPFGLVSGLGRVKAHMELDNFERLQAESRFNFLLDNF